MKIKDTLKVLEALDVSVILQTAPLEGAMILITNLIKYINLAIENMDLCNMYGDYTETEESIKFRQGIETCGLTLEELQKSILDSKHLPNEVPPINIKNLLEELSQQEEIEVLNLCLEYIDDGIENSKLKELRTTLLTIREEEELLKRQWEESDDYKDLPF